ncbi:terpene synthase-like [Xylocopa sonorina]|uniref:terpene synthase-like n=1 Tax=Xylocopa sonorina TaxID=1818115 RepID=UPI00403A81BD
MTHLAHNVNPSAVRIFSEQYIQIARGQGIDFYWRNNYICPSETECKVMGIQKCGIFVTIARLMLLFSDYKKDVTTLMGMLAIGGIKFIFISHFISHLFFINSCYTAFYDYLLAREYIDAIFTEICYAESKGYDDLTEGYFNFLIVHAIQAGPKGKEIMSILHSNYIELKRYCVSLLKKYGTYAYTRTVLEKLDKKMREEVEHLGGNPLFNKMLDELDSWKHGGDY